MFDNFFTGMVFRKEPRVTLDAVRMGKKKMWASSDKAGARSWLEVISGRWRSTPRGRLVQGEQICLSSRSSPPIWSRVAPLVRGWKHSQHVAQRHTVDIFENGDTVVAFAGMGPVPPGSPPTLAYKHCGGEVSSILSVGYAGALKPDNEGCRRLSSRRRSFAPPTTPRSSISGIRNIGQCRSRCGFRREEDVGEKIPSRCGRHGSLLRR